MARLTRLERPLIVLPLAVKPTRFGAQSQSCSWYPSLSIRLLIGRDWDFVAAGNSPFWEDVHVKTLDGIADDGGLGVCRMLEQRHYCVARIPNRRTHDCAKCNPDCGADRGADRAHWHHVQGGPGHHDRRLRRSLRVSVPGHDQSVLRPGRD